MDNFERRVREVLDPEISSVRELFLDEHPEIRTEEVHLNALISYLTNIYVAVKDVKAEVRYIQNVISLKGDKDSRKLDPSPDNPNGDDSSKWYQIPDDTNKRIQELLGDILDHTTGPTSGLLYRAFQYLFNNGANPFSNRGDGLPSPNSPNPPALPGPSGKDISAGVPWQSLQLGQQVTPAQLQPQEKKKLDDILDATDQMSNNFQQCCEFMHDKMEDISSKIDGLDVGSSQPYLNERFDKLERLINIWGGP